jgi:hypothetical protein
MENNLVETDTLVIGISKSKTIGAILMSTLFVLLGFLLLFADIQIPLNPILLKILGVIAVLFFGLALYSSLKRFSDKKAGLIFNKLGIIDNSNDISIGLIEWNDIIEINFFEIYKTKSILIFTENPEKYIAKVKPIQAKLMRLNWKNYGSPISISPQTLAIDFDVLYDMVLKEMKLNKTN